MDTSNREHLVGRAFVALADTLVDGYDVIDLLDQLVGHCVELLAAEAAGILLRDARGRLRVVAASSENARIMEILGLQSDEGPCLECYRTGTQVRVPDLAQTGPRWPRFMAEIGRSGMFASVHAIPLRLRGQTIGALNLFHRFAGPLPDADLDLAQALADVATVGILSERAIRRGVALNEQLQGALTSRVVIEQAKGVLSHQLSVEPGEAFARLRTYARANNQRLADLARDIVTGSATGQTLSAIADPANSPSSGA